MLAGLGLKAAALGARLTGIKWGTVLKVGVVLGMVGGVLFAVHLGVDHYKDLIKDRDLAQAEVAKQAESIRNLGATVVDRDDAIADWSGKYYKLEGTIQDLAVNSAEATSEIRRLNREFDRAQLDQKARTAPADVERRLRDDTARAYRLLDCASGTPSACGDPRPAAP